MEDKWLSWAKRIHGLAETGKGFTKDQYDMERYEEIETIAIAMLADLGDVPVASIRKLLSPSAKGYATPKIDVRGALIQDERILLVQEFSDGLWTLPGGYADVGYSAAENVVKEIWEEASVKTYATNLYGIKHKAKHDYDPDVRDFYKLLFICESVGECTPSAGIETTAARFFSIDELPPLSQGRTILADIEEAFAFVNAGPKKAYFD